MEETHYSISEAGKKVGVESHVLRYWEDELHLEIPRNGQGHRYYTELHIRLFQKIKVLKEKGYQLKAIEAVLKKMLDGGDGMVSDMELEQAAEAILKDGNMGNDVDGELKLKLVAKREDAALNLSPERMEQLQQIMNHVIGQAVTLAVRENSAAMSEEISRQVNDKMVQEFEYMMRISDEREEERFKMLDETIRSCQKESRGKAEAAAAKLPFFRRRRFGRSGKKL